MAPPKREAYDPSSALTASTVVSGLARLPFIVSHSSSSGRGVRACAR